MPAKLLLLLAHPLLERSRVNARLLREAAELPFVTVHDLYERYPTLAIDPKREQALLQEHDVFVFQHPFYWYSVPPLLKAWQDLVLEYGWAYGEGGTRLRGKVTLNAVSTGGPAETYQEGGRNRFTVRQLLAPWDATAHLCGMTWLPPFVVHGSHRLAHEAQLAPHAARYRTLLQALHDGTLDLPRALAAGQLDDPQRFLQPTGVA